MNEIKHTNSSDLPPKQQKRVQSHTVLLVTLFALVVVGATATVAELYKGMSDAKKPTYGVEILSQEKELAMQVEMAKIISSGNIQDCGQIAGVMYRNVCVNNMALNKAQETGDISFCEQLDDNLVSSDSCVRKILITKAIAKEDKNVCRETTNPTIQQECDDALLLLFAEKRRDPSICDQGGSKVAVDQCWNRYHAQLLETSLGGASNMSACAVFRGVDVISDCRALLGALAKKDTQMIKISCQKQLTRTFSAQCMMVERGVPNAFSNTNP